MQTLGREVGWLNEQGWQVSGNYHPRGELNIEVRAGGITIWLYRPKDQSLVMGTTYWLSECQLIRLIALDRTQYLNLIWRLKELVFSAGYILDLRPNGAELTNMLIGLQIWEPDITKNNVLKNAQRMIHFPQLIHALIERQLSVITPWELESHRALVQPPGEKPSVRLI